MTVVIPRGGRNAEERLEAEKAARKNRGSFNTWEYLSLAAPSDGEITGESKVIRLVLDEQDWRETRQHSFVNTKGKPSDYPADKKWPLKMGSVCRQSPGFDAIYDDCFICDDKAYWKEDKNGKLRKPYAGLRLWAVAVEREPLLGTKEMAEAGEIESYEVGQPVGYKDVEVEYEEEGVKKTRKKFLVLNFGLDNFFNALLGFANVYGTVLDRDYQITRKGSGTDTEYNIAPLDKQRVNGKVFDLRNPDFAAEYALPFDLDEIIANLASDEYYEWFFDTRVESSYAARFPNKDGEDSNTASASKTENAAAQDNATKDTIDKMRERFKASK